MLIHADALEALATLPAHSVDLVLTDPPYNIGKVADWDKIDRYIDWSIDWLRACARVLKPTGVLYFFHNDLPQIAQLMERIRAEQLYVYASFLIWDKGPGYRTLVWKDRDPDGRTALRSWFNRCEYILHYYAANPDAGAWDHTGLERVYSTASCFRPLKDWYAAEMRRLGLTNRRIGEAYTRATGRKPYMLRHYFCDSQFEIPIREIWDTVYRPLGFGTEYEALRAEYEALRAEYEALRNYHRCDAEHCNVLRRDVLNAAQKESGHPCEKPVDLLARLIRVSCPPGGTVLDPFAGGGSTCIAALQEGRKCIAIERDAHWVQVAAERIRRHEDAGGGAN